LNIVTIGVIFQIAGVLVFVFNLLRSLVKGETAGSDPWDAWTLEWSRVHLHPNTTLAKIPVVKSRRPLWDIKHPEDRIGSMNRQENSIEQRSDCTTFN